MVTGLNPYLSSSWLKAAEAYGRVSASVPSESKRTILYFAMVRMATLRGVSAEASVFSGSMSGEA